jgi:Metalloenzyme superfamily
MYPRYFCKTTQMKISPFFCAVFLYCGISAQTTLKTKHVFIITTDGFRWQEVFNGADSAIINDTQFVQDTSVIKDLYWAENTTERRKKLMPFFWNVIAKKGQLYGDRGENSKVNVRNIFKISYPGYNEILTGFADPILIPNVHINNRNQNVLEYFNRQKDYTGKVVAFTSWNMFPNILNIRRNNLYLNSDYDSVIADGEDISNKINEVQSQIAEKGHTRYDMLTAIAAKEYISHNHPKIVFLSFGETDELAHHNKYDLYLEQANTFDKMVAELWYAVQTDPFYKDNTTFIITTDHGRGNNKASWHGHNCFTKGSGEIWMAVIGPDTVPLGPMVAKEKIYQNQFASTIAMLLGEDFKSTRKIGKPIQTVANLNYNVCAAVYVQSYSK